MANLSLEEENLSSTPKSQRSARAGKLQKLKAVHRTIGIVAMIFMMYLAVTGLMIQGVDLRTIFTHAPATDPNLEAMREGFDGAGDYPVIVSTDYAAQALPANVDLDAVMQNVVQSARATLGNDSFRYVELRMVNGKLVGQVAATSSLTSFDGATGQLIQQGPIPRMVLGGVTVPSLRNTFKGAHRGLQYLGYIPLIGTYIRQYSLYIEVAVGLVLIAMIVTGIWMYFNLLNTRRRQGLNSGPFWIAGNWKRAAHRWVGIVASLFILIAACSGEWLAYESLYYGKQLATMRPQNGRQGAGRGSRGPNGQAGPNGQRGPIPNGQAMGGSQEGSSRANANASPTNAAQPNNSRSNGPGSMNPSPGVGRLNASSEPGQRGQDGPLSVGQEIEGGFRQTPLTPLKDDEIPWMMQVTLSSAREKTNNAPIKVIRLRNYAHYPQGVVVTGGDDVRQIVFNASTGNPMSEAEPGYPPTAFPFGWVAHQTAKSIHRGTFFGFPGRLLDIFAGLSLLYLCINGIALYFEVWWERRKNRKWSPFWA